MASSVVALIAGTANAQMVEDFEHGNIGLYATTGGLLNMQLVGPAAHDGLMGARFTGSGGPSWYYRTDVVTSPGKTYFTYVRVNTTVGPAGGRIYFGIAASPLGAFSAVAAPNTSELILMTNSGYGFTNSAVAAYGGYAADTWYRLGIEWTAAGTMKAKLWNESGSTLLAETAAVATTTTPGGVAWRGFHAGGSSWDADSVQALQAGCYPDCNGDGVLTAPDFGCYQTKFVAGDPYADCNGDGQLTAPDFGCFQTKFVLGCP